MTKSNDAGVEASEDPTLLHQIFARQASLTPDAIAVEYVERNERLTYQELARCTDWLAASLRQQGVGPNAIVATYLPRGIEQYVAILGILKAGGAYLPLDAKFPEDRIRFTLEDAEVRWVLTSEALHSEAVRTQSTPLFFETLAWRDAAKGAQPPPPGPPQQSSSDAKDGTQKSQSATEGQEPQAEDLCYVIYTSGTTGHPKGVGISHLNALTYVKGLMEVYGVIASDRVLQGFSIAFDASVEEIWMAFSSGATLVVGTLEVMQAVDELPDKLRELGISVFSTVPTLLSVMENDGLPHLQLLLFGGEAARDDIIEKWAAPGRRLFNGYGPTECTVVTTYDWCEPGKPVTIGKALPNYEVLILDDTLQEVPEGQEGELCVAGPAVSTHGYLGRPELNAKKFITHEGRRVYRTGDLVWRNPDGDLIFCGRIDTQVKIRGYRVELEEIETHLMRQVDCEGVIVHLHKTEDGTPQLLAYLLQKKPEEVDLSAILDALRVDLPDYMLPTHFVSIAPEAVPRQTSGKINRRALPPLEACHLLGHAGGASHTDTASLEAELAQASESERKLHTIWTEVLRQPIGLEDSFFDFGGNSVMAAQVITRCRKDQQLSLLTIRDLYQHMTVRAFARRLEARQAERTQTRKERGGQAETHDPGFAPAPQRVSPWEFRLVTSIQILFILFIVTTGGYLITGLIAGLYYGYFWISAWSENWLWWVLFFITFVTPPIALLLLFAFGFFWKWLFIGRYKVADYPVWSWGYLRWWVANFFLGPIYGLAGAFVGAPFVAFFYRLLGAKIGKRVYLGTALSETDLVTIEDDASIAPGARLRTHYIEAGVLKLRPIHIGKGAFVGPQATICGDVRMGDGAKLHPLSCLRDGFVAPDGTEWRGSPAVEVEPGTTAISRLLLQHEAQSKPNDFWEHWWDGLKLIIVQLIYLFGYSIVMLIPFGLTLLILLYLELQYDALLTLNLWILLPMSLFFASMRFFMLLGSLIYAKHTFTGEAKAGTIPINSREFVRRWMCSLLMGTLVDPRGTRGITETLFMPAVCRALGMKVGKDTEISDAEGFQPDLVSLGSGSMLADRCFLGAPIVHRGLMTLDHIAIGDRTFVANVAHVPITTPEVKDDCLIGVLSIAPDEMPESSDWLGSPPMRLPSRTVAQADISRTFEPPAHLVAARAFFNFWKMVLPGTLAEMAFWLTLKIGVNAFLALSWTGFLLFLPILTLGFNLVLISLPALFKWTLVGRYRSGEKPLWCNWMWRIEIVYEIELFFMSAYGSLLNGTPLLPMWYRMMGARIGKRVCMLGGSIMEADLVEIGDDVCIEGFLQTHLFEDRVMKLGRIRIQDGCSIRNEGCVLYDSQMGQHSILDDLSLIMKHETFLEHRKYRGLPAENVQ